MLLNAGRISSYTAIGVLLGLLGQIGISLDQTRWLQNGLFVAANVLLLFLGLYLAGLSTLVTKVEGLGRPVWRRSLLTCSGPPPAWWSADLSRHGCMRMNVRSEAP